MEGIISYKTDHCQLTLIPPPLINTIHYQSPFQWAEVMYQTPIGYECQQQSSSDVCLLLSSQYAVIFLSQQELSGFESAIQFTR